MRPIIISLLFCVFVSTAFGIICYDCESLSDPRCNQYFESDGVRQIDCDDADMPTYLHKYERRIPATGCLTKVHEGLEGRRFYIRRSCYFGDPKNIDEACDTPDPYVFWVDLISCTVCTEDLCNVKAAMNSGHHTSIALPKFALIGLTLAAMILHCAHTRF